MGLLAENKSRSKISKDPNNTRWTRDISSFGHKILHAQGWRPGQYLGAQNAAHSNLHTAANASYIRVSLKDDMKGLGFDKAKEAQVTGLDVFSDLLSRLNGKSKETIQGEKVARLAIKTNWYVERKWGPMRFVKGGLLVGESMVDKAGKEASPSSEQTIEPQVPTMDARKEERSKKRKAVDVEGDSEEYSTKKESKRRKREKRAATLLVEGALDEDAETTGTSSKEKEKEKEEKKEKKETEKKREKREKQEKEKKREKREKQEKRDKKEKDGKIKVKKRDLIKHELPCNDAMAGDGKDQASLKHQAEQEEESWRRKESAPGPSQDDKTLRKKDRKCKEEKKEKRRDTKPRPLDDATAEARCAPLATQGDSSEAAKESSTPVPLKGGRNFARSRFIAAKRQAMLDAKALNQIFMVKA
ncbi:hypothetical protein CDD82_5544 [Ophiocordyceps australis]|uniref:PinX1-related protein 1 n=1 Tax=Ophiocordyceps australis TaxID=1399860 RepID=A0A2C5Z1S3_9HYPO|nr:hypothetical protein CDD82_5544 [Ophiocordyceps australis]